MSTKRNSTVTLSELSHKLFHGSLPDTNPRCLLLCEALQSSCKLFIEHREGILIEVQKKQIRQLLNQGYGVKAINVLRAERLLVDISKSPVSSWDDTLVSDPQRLLGEDYNSFLSFTTQSRFDRIAEIKQARENGSL
jgi:hypothetical protein